MLWAPFKVEMALKSLRVEALPRQILMPHIIPAASSKAASSGRYKLFYQTISPSPICIFAITQKRTHLFPPITHAIMDSEKIPNLLEQQRDAAPEELQHYFLTFADCWERKLWHELTLSVMMYFEEDGSAGQRLELYDSFIKTFADKINKLKLVRLGLMASAECQGKCCTIRIIASQVIKTDFDSIDWDQSLAMEKALAEKVNKPASQDAYVFAQVAVARLYMSPGAHQGLPAARKLLDECEGILEHFDSVETVVHASFYRENASYFHVCLLPLSSHIP